MDFGFNTSLSSKRKSGLRQHSKLPSVNIVLKSPQHIVERFGVLVPVLVEEAFSFSDKNVLITAKVSDCGYAWVVCGRRLYVWQFYIPHHANSPKLKRLPICHELKLPQSDLAHRAELVTVFLNKNSNFPSCIAVSPEGMVRYWSDISHDHCSVDEHVDLNGQECDSLIYVNGLGGIFVTTTCTVVLVQHIQGSYSHEVKCRLLRTPGSWLGGISKRVSSIFFGPMSSDQGNETRIIRLLSIPNIQQLHSVYVLAGLSLQKWTISEKTTETEQLLWSIDLTRPIKEAFRTNINNWDVSDYTEVDIWILDMQPDRDGVLMLCAGVNLHLNSQVYYAMASIHTNTPTPPVMPKDFLLLKLMGSYRDDSPGDSLNCRLIMSGCNAYIYNSKSIHVIKPQEEHDTLEFHNPNDQIFSGTMCSGKPLFFSRHYGLVSITSTSLDTSISFSAPVTSLETSFNDQSLAANNLSVYHMDPYEIYTAHRDTASQLKAAFIFHVKNQLTECYDMINTLFPSDVPLVPGFDGPLDVAIAKIAKDILDDIPAGDPRWTQGDHGTQGLGSSHSMLVLHQLIDKQKAFTLYLKFIKESGLWDKLAGLTVRDSHMTTIYFLSELAEKITASIVLKKLPVSVLFEDALEKTVRKFASETGSGLSRQDIFFREVSRVHEGILWLSKICDDVAHSAMGPIEVAAAVHEANSIMLAVFSEVIQYRQQNKELFSLTEVARSLKLEYLPWTASGGSEGVVDALMLQHSLTVNYGLKVTTREQLTNELLGDFVLLTDIILDGRKSHLTTVLPGGREKVLHKQYCSDRNKLIKPLVQEKAWDKAAMLAEKYLDFDILIAVCESTNNDERLNEYMRRFKDTGFPEFVYNWYLREGKQAKLLNRYRVVSGRVPEGQERLCTFLKSYPSLNWIQQTFDKNYAAAADTLRLLGEKETELVTRQKTIFSLCKLAKVAGK
ncbi:nuclear pore complex protein Nup133 isoform X2 [Rhynchophorus ferrugineus]|uniref:nuclear pore complex protein Nup133 isoform X2 n=1 Tax=Rhynchophorus ferrugineus TaxID=354439 RepID=UPI003FCDEE4E